MQQTNKNNLKIYFKNAPSPPKQPFLSYCLNTVRLLSMYFKGEKKLHVYISQNLEKKKKRCDFWNSNLNF